jgi:arylsulfatase A-like enzyme
MWTGYETGNPASGERYQNAYIHTRQGSKTYRGLFGPDVYTDFLIDFMKRHRDEPMCLYFPMALTHGPLVPTPDEPEVTDKYGKHKAMVRYTDKLVGRLVRALDELRIRQRTIVIFTTDNGTSGGIRGRIAGRQVQGGKAKESENGICAPFIVSCPGRVPSAVESNALTDFSDLLPTFVELAGGQVPTDLTIDGVSIAPVLLGKAQESGREWILAMGHGAARRDEKGVRGVHDFATRVIRDQRFKVWVSNQKEIFRLHDLRTDPREETNLFNSDAPMHREAIRKFQVVLDTLPDRDARPAYVPRASNPWDRKVNASKQRKKDRKRKRVETEL